VQNFRVTGACSKSTKVSNIESKLRPIIINGLSTPANLNVVCFVDGRFENYEENKEILDFVQEL
jgi:hypothetical protein